MKSLVKRAYDPVNPEDGFRVYVDRIWPRGLSHLSFKYDLWDKEIAPSTELRRWFHSNPVERWEEFQAKYREELAKNPALAQFENMIVNHPIITLLYSSREHERNNAVVLKNYLKEKYKN